MAQTQVTIPQTALAVGTHGPFTTPVIPSNVSRFVVNITKVVWPADGAGDVMTLTVEESNDGGATWRFSASDTWAGGLTTPKGGGAPILTDWWVTDLLFPNQPNCKLRLTLQVLQACTVSGTVGVQ